MSTTLRHMAIRPLIGVLASLVLASSATVAVAAETHAAPAKAPPVPSFSNLECQQLAGPQTVVNGDLKVTGKGRWVFVSVQYRVDEVTGWEDELGTVDEPFRLNRQADKSLSGGPVNGTGTKGWFSVRLYDRKGAPLPDTDQPALFEAPCPTP